jgi:hypothetical protein
MPARRALLAILAVVAVTALLPAVSASGAGGTTTKVVVSLKLPAFHGTLKSSKSACIAGRTVKLYLQKSGPDKLLGTDKSEDNGKWLIRVGKKTPPPGSYYASAPAHGSCKAGKSSVLPVA